MILKRIKRLDKERYIYIKFYYETICQELRNERWIIFYLLCCGLQLNKHHSKQIEESQFP
jgi:hypothetical protein